MNNTTMIENTTAVKFKVGQIVKPVGYTKSNTGLGEITDILEPIGTAGEWSYEVRWSRIGYGGGWRDCDITKA